MNQETYLYHHGVKGMKWGVRKDKYKSMTRSQKREQKKRYKANSVKERLTKSAKAYAKSERAIAKEYKDIADKLSKQSTIDYVKENTGYDISTKKGAKAYANEYGIDPNSAKKHDINKYTQWSNRSSENAKKFDKLVKQYGNMKIDGLSDKDVVNKGRELLINSGVPIMYRVRSGK